MPTAFAADALIDRPAEHVWRILTDWPAAPRWMNGVDAMRSDGPTAVGTALTFEARGKARTTRITACQPMRSVTLTSSQGPVMADYTYGIEPVDGDRARVSLVADCRVAGPMRLMGPLVRYAIRKADGAQLAALKAVVEEE